MTGVKATSSAPKPVGRLEWAVLFALVLMFSEGVLHRLVSPEINVDGSPILRLAWLPIYAGLALAALWQSRQMVAAMFARPLFVALAILACCSFAWSLAPTLSLRRGVALGTTVVFALYLAVRLGPLDLLRLLGWSWLLLAGLSLISGVVSPGFAQMTEVHVGAWRGFWYEKNTLGGHMARAGLLFAGLSLLDSARRRVWLMGLASASALVLLSTSKTALLGLVLGLAFFCWGCAMARGWRQAVLLGWLGSFIALIAGAVFLLAPDLVFDLLGRDPSLTGRTEIWGALSSAISDRPWLGHGYGVFWIEQSEPAFWVRQTVQWDAPTAHNGWFETALGLGLVGLALAVLDYLWILAKAGWVALKSPFALLVAATLAQLLLFSLSESVIAMQNSIVWVTYGALTTSMALQRRSAKSKSADLGVIRPKSPHRSAASAPS